MNRLCRKYPLLCEMESRTIDTIFRIEFLPKLDTIKVVNSRVDTFTIHDNGDTIRVVLRQDPIYMRDTVQVERFAKPDTVTTIREKEVIKYRSGRKWWVWVLLTLLGVGIIGVVRGRIIKKMSNE